MAGYSRSQFISFAREIERFITGSDPNSFFHASFEAHSFIFGIQKQARLDSPATAKFLQHLAPGLGSNPAQVIEVSGEYKRDFSFIGLNQKRAQAALPGNVPQGMHAGMGRTPALSVEQLQMVNRATTILRQYAHEENHEGKNEMVSNTEAHIMPDEQKHALLQAAKTFNLDVTRDGANHYVFYGPNAQSAIAHVQQGARKR